MANLERNSSRNKQRSKDFEKESFNAIPKPTNESKTSVRPTEGINASKGLETAKTANTDIQPIKHPTNLQTADKEPLNPNTTDYVGVAQPPVVFTHRKTYLAPKLDADATEGIRFKWCNNTAKVKASVKVRGSNQSRPKQSRGISTNGRMNRRTKERVKDAIQHLGTNKRYLNLITLTQGRTNMSAPEFRYFLGQCIKALKKYIEKPSKKSGRKKGKHFRYVWVLELQEQRARTTGEYALHAHIVTDNYIPDGNNAINRIFNNVLKNYCKKEGIKYEPINPNRTTVAMCVKSYVIKTADGQSHRLKKGDKRKALANYLTKGSAHPIEGKLSSMDQRTSKAIKYIEHYVPTDAPNETIHQLFTMFEAAYIYDDYVGNRVLRIYNAKGFEILEALDNLPERPEPDL